MAVKESLQPPIKEITRNSEIATKIKDILNREKQADPQMYHLLFLSPNLPGNSIVIFSSAKGEEVKNILKKVKPKLALPVYALSLNRLSLLIKNTSNGEIYKTYVVYFFNERGRGLKQVRHVKWEDSRSYRNAKESKIPKHKLPAESLDTDEYTKLTAKDYSITDTWLNSIMGGGCTGFVRHSNGFGPTHIFGKNR